jgi:hypothetical protein
MMTSLEIYVHQSALRDGDPNLRAGVERALSEYGDRVTHGVVRLERLDVVPERYACCIDLGVRWWGRLCVEEAAADPRRAVDRALDGLAQNLEAFVGDLAS